MGGKGDVRGRQGCLPDLPSPRFEVPDRASWVAAARLAAGVFPAQIWLLTAPAKGACLGQKEGPLLPLHRLTMSVCGGGGRGVVSDAGAATLMVGGAMLVGGARGLDVGRLPWSCERRGSLGMTVGGGGSAACLRHSVSEAKRACQVKTISGFARSAAAAPTGVISFLKASPWFLFLLRVAPGETSIPGSGGGGT